MQGFTIAASENAVSAAERRAIINEEKHTQVWISDLVGIIPSITGKIELVYEGEQEGPYQVAFNLLENATRTIFSQYFPNPDTLKKKRGKEASPDDNPYKSITRWFDSGKHLDVFFETRDEDKIQLLYKVDGLHALVKKYYKTANETENALLDGVCITWPGSLFAYISKKVLDGKIEFKDLMGSMLNMGSKSFSEDDFNDNDFN